MKRSGDVEPVVDPSQDYVLMLGYENATHTVMRFKRKLETCDTSYDIPISVSVNFFFYFLFFHAENDFVAASQQNIQYNNTYHFRSNLFYRLLWFFHDLNIVIFVWKFSHIFSGYLFCFLYYLASVIDV